MNKFLYTKWIKEETRQLGFDYCGIAKAEFLSDDARRLESWLKKGMHGSMQYMENYFDMRVDPTLLVPGAKSVITLLMNYFPDSQQQNNVPRISKYAYGEDYHVVIREKMKELLARLKSKIGDINGRGFVDSAPVLERAWAKKSGLGWIGKNGNLITRSGGSFFFIATLIIDIELDYDDAIAQDYCGSCSRCIDACPTQAILPDKTINGSQCISYFTIELKEMLIPDSVKGQFNDWAFGCDTCQDVCPWNRFSKATTEERFSPIQEVLNLSTSDWEMMSDEAFKKIFSRSPLSRTKHKGMMRNIEFLKK